MASKFRTIRVGGAPGCDGGMCRAVANGAAVPRHRGVSDQRRRGDGAPAVAANETLPPVARDVDALRRPGRHRHRRSPAVRRGGAVLDIARDVSRSSSSSWSATTCTGPSGRRTIAQKVRSCPTSRSSTRRFRSMRRSAITTTPTSVYYKPFNMNGERYYSFKKDKLGNPGVRFFALDSNYMTREQLEWLEKELAASGSDWKIAFFHHPLYSSGGRHGSEVDLRDQARAAVPEARRQCRLRRSRALLRAAEAAEGHLLLHRRRLGQAPARRHSEDGA